MSPIEAAVSLLFSFLSSNLKHNPVLSTKKTLPKLEAKRMSIEPQKLSFERRQISRRVGQNCTKPNLNIKVPSRPWKS